MAEFSAISWCDNTFNPWIGCSKVSPACDHCYAEALMDHRHHRVTWGGPRSLTSEANWRQPLRWNRKAKADGVRRKVFCASLADVFDNQVHEDWRNRLWLLIKECDQLDWLLLTKRPQNIKKMLPIGAYTGKPWGEGWPNVWLGTTTENQEEANRRIPALLAVPAAVHFISAEPLLGPIDLCNLVIPRRYGSGLLDAFTLDFKTHHQEVIAGPPKGHGPIDWVIGGGESGAQARPTRRSWAFSLRDQSAAAGIPFHWKQNGEFVDADEWLALLQGGPGEITKDGAPWHPPVPLNFTDAEILASLTGRSGKTQSHSDGSTMIRVGKHASGRMLDGRIWDQFPNP